MMKSEDTDYKIVGVDLGGTNVTAGVVDGDRITKKTQVDISADESKEKVISEVKESISNIWSGDIDGIGMGVPSLVDSKKGIVTDVINIPSWERVHLKEILEDEFEVPVYINNDANCFAVGEKYFGKGKDIENMVGLIIGTGLGAGIIANGHLYSGEYCGAGEFGMIKYKDKNYESYCSGTALQEIHNIKGERLYEKAENNDEEALQIFQKFGKELGEAIKTILYSLAPEMIILGGSVSNSTKYFLSTVKQELEGFPYQNLVDNLQIEISEVENISIYGAAALYLDYINK